MNSLEDLLKSQRIENYRNCGNDCDNSGNSFEAFRFRPERNPRKVIAAMFFYRINKAGEGEPSNTVMAVL
jgi:hypothetical protein